MPPRTPARWLTGLFFALALLAAWALGPADSVPTLDRQGPAQEAAAQEIIIEGSPVSSVSRIAGEMLFTALPDESTQVQLDLLTDAPPRYLLTSSEPVFASTGCTAVSQFSAYCTVTVDIVVTLNLQDGAFDGVDTATIRSSRTNDVVGVSAGAGDDVVVVDSDGGATGPVTMIGGAGSFDELWLDDSQSASGRTYTVIADSMTRTGSGAYSHNGVETVRLFGGGGTDVVTVNATAAATTSLISTGAGFDTIQIGVTTLDPLDGAIFVDGEANNDTVTLKDTGSGNNHSFSIGPTNIVRAGFAGVTLASVESVWIDGGSGVNQWNVSGTSGALQLTGGAGIDSFTVANNLDAIAAPMTIDGKGNFDTLHIDDRGNLAPASYTVTGTQIARQIGPPITQIIYSAIEGIELDTQDAASTIWIAGTSANVHVFGHGGDDLVKIGDGTVNNVAHTVNVYGGAGSDDILIDDTTDALGGGSYSINSQEFDRVNGNFGQLRYFDMESFTLNAHETGNEIGVTSTADGVEYVLNGGEGPDEMGFGFDLEFHLGDLLVRGNGGVDGFTVNDTAQATGNTYELRAGRIERVAQVSRSPMRYEGVENVKLVTGAGSETVVLMGTVPATTTTIETGDLADSVSVFAAGLAASGLAVVNCGPGSDGLGFFDGGLGSSSNGSTFTTPGRHNVNYSQCDNAAVQTSDADVDDDGCLDTKEIGPNRIFGGERSPLNFYDWFDVAGLGGPEDNAIDLLDTLAILARFGLGPGDEGDGYSSIYDRVALYPDLLWRPFPAYGQNLGIDVQDVVLNLQSFGHSCI